MKENLNKSGRNNYLRALNSSIGGVLLADHLTRDVYAWQRGSVEECAIGMLVTMSE